MLDVEKAVEIVKRETLYGLCGTDGCLCGSCSIQEVHIDISCRKSSGHAKVYGDSWRGVTVRVYSRTLWTSVVDVGTVANEVVRQIQEITSEDIRVRYCDYEHDADKKCIYCSKTREKSMDYLCAECLVNADPFRGKIYDQYSYDKLPWDYCHKAQLESK